MNFRILPGPGTQDSWARFWPPEYDFIFERLKYLWNKCESDLLYNKASDFISRVLIKKRFSIFHPYRASVIFEPILSAIRRVSGPLLSIRRTTWRRSMGRKTPQGRAGKLIRPLTNRITNRFTNRDGLRLTTAYLVYQTAQINLIRQKVSHERFGIESSQPSVNF